MKKLLILVASLTTLALSFSLVRADVVLSSIISNGMVFQRGVPAPVWGWADAGEEVTVECGGQVKKAMPGPDRKWIVDLDPLEASTTPKSMTISGKNKILIENILVGEVWIASGQSNMDWSFDKIAPTEREFAESQKENPLVRAFHVYRNLKAGIPMDDTPGVWKDAAQMVTKPNTVSAVGFFFALDLAKSLGIPVAILDVNWGGQKIECFLAPEGYQAAGLPFKEPDRRVSRSGQEAPQEGLKTAFNVRPTHYGEAENFIYNAMVAPLAPYAVQGTIWYQGESNRGSADYLKKLQALSAGWSRVFRVKDMPFLLVQIAPYDYVFSATSKGKPPTSASLLADTIWTAQYKAADTIPGVAVIPIHDTNIDIKSVHPIHKRPVGERLAAAALKNQYKKEGVVASAPRFQSASREGSKVVVSFSGILNGLTTTDGQAPSWFELSSDGVSFVPAQAEIKGNTVLVSAESIPEPKFVRMGWRDIAIANLKDKDAWPVFAFPSQPVAEQPAIPHTATAPNLGIVAHRGSSAQAPENTLPAVIAAAPPFVCWTFDEARDAGTVQPEKERLDSLQGAIEVVPGVRGSGLKFDGFTSRLVRAAKDLPPFGPALTVEAWIAPQEYSWAWTGLVDHNQDARAGFFLALNHLGHVGFYASVDGQWLGCDSKEPLALLKWAHVAGTFDPAFGFTLYVNGQRVGVKEAKGKLKPAEGLDLLIGRSNRKQFPALTEREVSKKFLANMVFDGLIDEVRIHQRALDAAEIKASWMANQPANAQPLQFRVLPSGPKEPRPFGAYYTRLAYCPEWDRLWRTGDVADVLVCFGDSPVRVVFWRGTGYCPAWVTENGKWVSDQSPESWNMKTWGCFENMSDKRCHFSHVRILESSEARAVVHWRVASASINYDFNNVDPDTGWGEWTDEYYSIYPDAVAVRYQEVRSTWAEKMEWQQTELLNQPGTRPQDNVETEAMTIMNMRGETETWSWATPYGKRAPGSAPIQDGNIQVMNLKASQRHFVIGETGAHWKPFDFGALEGFSTMPCWNSWPVAQLPNDGRVTPAVDRPSATCLGTLYPVKHKTNRPDLMTGRNLYGLTDKPAGELAVLSRSWNFPADITLSGKEFSSQGYDKNQRAYRLTCQQNAKPGTLEMTLVGSERSPVLNPAFVVKNWGEANATLTLDGKPIPRGKDFRFGHRQTLESTDLIVWIKTESQASLTFRLEPQPQP